MSSRSSASSACQGNKLYEAGVGSSQKVRDPAQGRVPRKLHTATYPLVTTGGGALPLPTPVPQPATLRRASTAAVAKAIFFMGSPLSHDRGSLDCNPALTSAERTHLHEIRRDRASRQITAAPLGRWRRGHRGRRATATRGRHSAQSRRVVREWVMLSQTVKCEACQKRDRTASRVARGLTRPRCSFSPP